MRRTKRNIEASSITTRSKRNNSVQKTNSTTETSSRKTSKQHRQPNKTIKQKEIEQGRKRRSVYNILQKNIRFLTAKMCEMSEELKKTKESGLQIERINEEEMPIRESSTSFRESLPEERTVVPIVEVAGDLTEPKYQQITYNVHNVNFERPKFSGSAEDQPVTFLEDLESYLKKINKDGSDLDLILECLVGEARDWARVYKYRWNTLEHFKKDFLSTYWGEKEQSELRKSIVSGQWDRAQTPSMLSHFLRLVGKAQMLNYPIPEKQLVVDLMKHFPKNIQQVWESNHKETIIETAEFLRRMDNVNKQESHQFVRAKVNKDLPEDRKREHQRGYNNWKKPVGGGGGSQARINSITTVPSPAEAVITEEVVLN